VENNVAFLPGDTPAHRTLVALAKRRFPVISQIPYVHPELQRMVQELRETHGSPFEPQKMRYSLWFGIKFENHLACAIGFNENYSTEEGLWLYIIDVVCGNSVDDKKWFKYLMDFNAAVPYMTRGIIQATNPMFMHVVGRYGWALKAWCVEKSAKEYE
jgi:hypothetical protein